MGTATGRRRALVITLGVGLLLLFLALATLNAFNLNFLNPASPMQTLVFIALSVLAFLLFVCVLILLVRNVLKLYADQRSHVLGTRLRTRMLWGAVLVSAVPLVFMFAFSYLLLNRAVDRWFSQPVTQMREGAGRLASELFNYAEANARSEADSVAIGLSDIWGGAKAKPSKASLAVITRELQRHELSLQGGFAVIYRDNEPVASLHVPSARGTHATLKTLQPPESETDENPDRHPPVIETDLHAPGLQTSAEQAILQAAQRNDGQLYTIAGTDYTLATAGLKNGGLVVVGLPIPSSISATSLQLRSAADAYWTLFRERRQVRALYMVLLLLTTSLALFACCWLALNVSKQVTRPVESLAEAMDAIAAGDYAHRVGSPRPRSLASWSKASTPWLRTWSPRMSLPSAPRRSFRAQCGAARSAARELETIIETIPNGVVTLAADRTIVLSNRAFSEMLDPGGQKQFVGPELLPRFCRRTSWMRSTGCCAALTAWVRRPRRCRCKPARARCTCPRQSHLLEGGAQRRAAAPRLRAGAGKCDRTAARAKAERLEGSRAPRGA